jgi:beta-galactosidase
MRPGDAEAAPTYFTGGWKYSANPLPMGADGDDSAYAWYRAILPTAHAGAYTLHCSDVGDWISVFVNGAPAGASAAQQRFDRPVSRDISVTLRNGVNTIAVLAAHYGRNKLVGYLGPIDTIDAKGLAGPVTLALRDTAEKPITNWRWRPSTKGTAEAAQIMANTETDDWRKALIGQDLFGGRVGFAWLRTTLPDVPGPHRVLHFDSVDDNGVIYLNGKRLLRHEGWNLPFDVSLDSAWRKGGPNRLVVLVENTAGVGGVMGPVTLEARANAEDTPVRGWKLRGGIGDPEGRPQDWRPYRGIAATNVPTFYRATFIANPPAAAGPHPILRLSTLVMSRGFVWLNGHNLGRYPEKVPVDGLYLPECWLKPGLNEIVIFDELGFSPIQARIVIEQAASRTAAELHSTP